MEIPSRLGESEGKDLTRHPWRCSCKGEWHISHRAALSWGSSAPSKEKGLVPLCSACPCSWMSRNEVTMRGTLYLVLTNHEHSAQLLGVPGPQEHWAHRTTSAPGKRRRTRVQRACLASSPLLGWQPTREHWVAHGIPQFCWENSWVERRMWLGKQFPARREIICFHALEGSDQRSSTLAPRDSRWL